MIGMTGFGSAEETEGDVSVSVRIKSYNNRYLDLKLTLPPELADAESELRRAVQERVARGRVELLFSVTENAPADIPVLNEEQARAYAAVFARLKQFFPDAESPPTRYPGAASRNDRNRIRICRYGAAVPSGNAGVGTGADGV